MISGFRPVGLLNPFSQKRQFGKMIYPGYSDLRRHPKRKKKHRKYGSATEKQLHHLMESRNIGHRKRFLNLNPELKLQKRKMEDILPMLQAGKRRRVGRKAGAPRRQDVKPPPQEDIQSDPEEEKRLADLGTLSKDEMDISQPPPETESERLADLGTLSKEEMQISEPVQAEVKPDVSQPTASDALSMLESQAEYQQLADLGTLSREEMDITRPPAKTETERLADLGTLSKEEMQISEPVQSEVKPDVSQPTASDALSMLESKAETEKLADLGALSKDEMDITQPVQQQEKIDVPVSQPTASDALSMLESKAETEKLADLGTLSRDEMDISQPIAEQSENERLADLGTLSKEEMDIRKPPDTRRDFKDTGDRAKQRREKMSDARLKFGSKKDKMHFVHDGLHKLKWTLISLQGAELRLKMFKWRDQRKSDQKVGK